MKIDASFRRAWRWIAVVIVLAACLLTVILVRTRALPGQLANNIGARSSQVRANPASREARPSIDAQRSPGPMPGPVVTDEFCGVNGPDRVRTGNETIEQHVARLTQHAINQWQSELAASEDPRRRAIGLALTDAEPGGHTFTPEALTLGSEPWKDTPATNNLVLLATETGDSAIYSLAIGQCRGGANDMAAGPCQGLSWEHWANIDPDNGMPWLWIAVKAERVGDQQRVEEALAKASTASRIEGYGNALSALALRALPGDTAPLEKAAAGADVISILSVVTPIKILSLCSETSIPQTLRKQQCSAIATTLAKQGSTFNDLVLASTLADRLGFPEETRSALNVELKNALIATSSYFYPWQRDSHSDFRCDTVLAYDSFIDTLRAAGGNERAALRAFARAGRPAVQR